MATVGVIWELVLLQNTFLRKICFCLKKLDLFSGLCLFDLFLLPWIRHPRFLLLFLCQRGSQRNFSNYFKFVLEMSLKRNTLNCLTILLPPYKLGENTLHHFSQNKPSTRHLKIFFIVLSQYKFQRNILNYCVYIFESKPLMIFLNCFSYFLSNGI